MSVSSAHANLGSGLRRNDVHTLTERHYPLAGLFRMGSGACQNTGDAIRCSIATSSLTGSINTVKLDG